MTLNDKEESSNEQNTEQQPAVPEEEETKEMTLDEWKALRGERTKPQYNIRKPNEGEDTSEWKKMIVLNKKKGSESSEEEYEYDPSMYPQRVGRLQRIVDIQFNFNDGRRGGGGSGFGRGRGRGRFGDRGNRGGDFGRQDGQKNYGGGNRSGGGRNFGGDRQTKRDRFNNTAANNLKMDDESQFPTLS